MCVCVRACVCVYIYSTVFAVAGAVAGAGLIGSVVGFICARSAPPSLTSLAGLVAPSTALSLAALAALVCWTLVARGRRRWAMWGGKEGPGCEGVASCACTR